MGRAKNKNIAEDTLKTLEQGYYLNSQQEKINLGEAVKNAVSHTKLYEPQVLETLIAKPRQSQNDRNTSFQVINETTLNAAGKLIVQGFNDVLCLNFASAKNAGGGFLNGSQAQEESIARASGLYPCLLKCKAYYEANRKNSSCLYTDYMIYSPHVPVLKDEEGNYLAKPLSVSFITAPAVNANVVRQKEPANVPKIEAVMKRRINMVLGIALENKHENIVLGAWGCGVFGNDPKGYFTIL
ncbi:MAG: TIGR02452 family protein [Chitinophagales bacterium]|nr:TIGR02452 family protein [Bacteroidota bacterium]